MTPPTEHSELAELAPFYVAGTLSADEAARFEAALAEDAELARNVAAARSERDEVLALNEALPGPSPRAYDMLFAQIGAEPPRRMNIWRQLDLGARLAQILSPRALGWAVATACLLVCVEAGFLVANHGNPAGGYRTASQPREDLEDTGAFALVAFAPEANANAIFALLDKARVQIVEGPKTGGFYRIRLGGPDMTPLETHRRLEILRQANGVVSFVSWTR
jgi:plasmid stabilization system protein ParE